MAPRPQKVVLDTNCYIDASRTDSASRALQNFCAAAAPGLYMSAVVASELRAGASERDRARLERDVVTPFSRRDRLLVPSGASWVALGTTLAALRKHEGLVLKQVPRSFLFDILIAHSCREAGAVLISRNTADMKRIARVFSFDFAEPYPTRW